MSAPRNVMFVAVLREMTMSAIGRVQARIVTTAIPKAAINAKNQGAREHRHPLARNFEP
jgi:hypothetical protein